MDEVEVRDRDPEIEWRAVSPGFRRRKIRLCVRTNHNMKFGPRQREFEKINPFLKKRLEIETYINLVEMRERCLVLGFQPAQSQILQPKSLLPEVPIELFQRSFPTRTPLDLTDDVTTGLLFESG